MGTIRLRPLRSVAIPQRRPPMLPPSAYRLQQYSELKSSKEIDAFLSQPSWSLKSIFDSHNEESAPEITQKQLHHLLRLSALPLPTSQEDEAEMISDLQSQLKFVQAIQEVDVEGVEPLQSIRDETKEAEAENEITVETLKADFAKEQVVGQRGRIIRRKEERKDNEKLDWDPLAQAPRKVRGFFAVDIAKD